MRLLDPLGPELPFEGRLWHWYYRILGVPSYRSQLVWHNLLRVLKPLRFDTLLDVGCGAGAITVGLAKRWPEVKFHGVDHDSSSIARARHLAERAGAANVDWSVGSFEEFRGGMFDVVVSLGLFEFVENPATDLARIAGFVHDGGWLVVTSPHAKTKGERSKTRHTKSDMREWMVAAGCEDPSLLEMSRSISCRIYAGSQRLQEKPFEAAAYHLLTFPIVSIDEHLPGAGDLLMCHARVVRG